VATRRRRTALDDVRAVAGKWETTIGTLLGIIGVVAFIEGPDKLADMPDAAQWVLIVTVAIAAGLALGAVILAALAAQGTPRRFRTLTGRTLARTSAAAAETAVRNLNVSRGLAIAAASLLVAGTLVAWGVGISQSDDEKTAPNVVVETVSGALRCGVLAVEGEGVGLVNAEKTPIVLDGVVTLLEVVDACP
jgi:hypothetical protein